MIELCFVSGFVMTVWVSPTRFCMQENQVTTGCWECASERRP